MPQVFARSANTISLVSIVVIGLLLAGAIFGMMGFDRSRYVTDVGLARQQPVPFSHQHHFTLGLNNLY